MTCRVFMVINQDGSGHLNFTEFLVALWNICSRDNAGLIQFGWQLFDVHDKGKLKYAVVKEFIQCVHGNDFDIRSTMNYLAKKLGISSKDLKDKYKEVWVTEHELQEAAAQFHSLFLPLQECKIRCQEQFLGEKWWESVVRERRKQAKCMELKDLLALSVTFHELRLAKGTLQRNLPPARSQWRGDRDALGTVAFDQYGNKEAKPIEVKPGAAVVWNEKENRFVPETRDFNRVQRSGMYSPGAVALALQEQGDKPIDTAEKYSRSNLDGPVYRT